MRRYAVYGAEEGRRRQFEGAGPQRDPRDVRRIGRLERDKARLERDKAELTEERDCLKRRNEHLEKEFEAAQRRPPTGGPFAKDRPLGSGKRPGRRAGRTAESGVPPEAGAGLTRSTRRRPRRPARTAAARPGLGNAAEAAGGPLAVT